MMFGVCFDVEVQARFLSWSLVTIFPLYFAAVTKLNPDRSAEARFSQYFEF